MPSTTVTRRRILGTFFSFPLLILSVSGYASTDSAADQLRALEKEAGGRLGVYAINTGSGKTVSYRANERFTFCSTFKVIAASAILKHSETTPDFLTQRIHYQPSDIVTYSPVSEKHVQDGMTLAELSAAAMQYSDNTAANLMIKALGGTDKITGFARTLGDQAFRLDRWETELNNAVPGDERDTTTPAAMSQSLEKLVLGTVLGDAQRQQLITWMKGNAIGTNRIRPGVPATWEVADKTGSGDYGTVNGVAVLWPAEGAPVVISVYYTREVKDAQRNDGIIASATRIALTGLEITQDQLH